MVSLNSAYTNVISSWLPNFEMGCRVG